MLDYNLTDMLKRLKDTKKKQKITNKELSTITGIPLGTINKILSGDSKDPSVSAIIKISKALNVSTDYIITGEFPAQKQIVSNIDLNQHELDIIKAYRAHPEMRDAVDKLLGVEPTDTETRESLSA